MSSLIVDRHVPRLGGFSMHFMALEICRALRNRRTVIFTLIVPPAFFLLFGTSAYTRRRAWATATSWPM